MTTHFLPHLHICVRLHLVFNVLNFDSCHFEHLEAVRFIVIMLFAHNSLYAAVNDEHRTRSARRHLAIQRRAVNRDAALGSLTNCILLGVNGAHAMLCYRAVVVKRFPKQMPHIVAMRQARRRANIACYQNLIVAGDYAPASSTVARCAFGNRAAHFHKIFVPCRTHIITHGCKISTQ